MDPFSTIGAVAIRFLIVDALNLIRRVHAATPEDKEPQHTEAARNATVLSLKRALGHARPTHVVAIFDGEGPTWRDELYADYKAGRKPMPEALRAALSSYWEAFSELGVASVEKPALEADDVVATLASKAAEHESHAIILSTDHAYCQLISNNITLRDHFQKQDRDRGYVQKKFDVPPEQLVDLWALAGSSSTHIPGVPGIGLKTAAKLLHEHESLSQVLDAASEMNGKLGIILRENSDMARMSRELSELRQNLELGWNLKDFKLSPPSGAGR